MHRGGRLLEVLKNLAIENDVERVAVKRQLIDARRLVPEIPECAALRRLDEQRPAPFPTGQILRPTSPGANRTARPRAMLPGPHPTSSSRMPGFNSGTRNDAASSAVRCPRRRRVARAWPWLCVSRVKCAAAPDAAATASLVSWFVGEIMRTTRETTAHQAFASATSRQARLSSASHLVRGGDCGSNRACPSPLTRNRTTRPDKARIDHGPFFPFSFFPFFLFSMRG